MQTNFYVLQLYTRKHPRLAPCPQPCPQRFGYLLAEFIHVVQVVILV